MKYIFAILAMQLFIVTAWAPFGEKVGSQNVLD